TEDTAKTPALSPSAQKPPRTSAPGRLPKVPLPLGLPLPPKQLRSCPAMGAPTTGVCVVQSVQLFARALQSATPSDTFPSMSHLPQPAWQFARAPVLGGPAEFVAHVGVASSAFPASGVPAAARCHSSFRTRRLPDAAHACTA